MIHLLKWTEWTGVRFHHIIQNDMQFKTYKLFISGLFHLILASHRKQICNKRGLLQVQVGQIQNLVVWKIILLVTFLLLILNSQNPQLEGLEEYFGSRFQSIVSCSNTEKAWKSVAEESCSTDGIEEAKREDKSEVGRYTYKVMAPVTHFKGAPTF